MCNEFRHKGAHVNIICLYQPKKTKVSPYLGTQFFLPLSLFLCYKDSGKSRKPGFSPHLCCDSLIQCYSKWLAHSFRQNSSFAHVVLFFYQSFVTTSSLFPPKERLSFYLAIKKRGGERLIQAIKTRKENWQGSSCITLFSYLDIFTLYKHFKSVSSFIIVG